MTARLEIRPLLGGCVVVRLDDNDRQIARFEGTEAQANAALFVAVLTLAAALKSDRPPR